MLFTYYGHATFCVVINGKTILFDPFFNGNPSAAGVDPLAIKADFIFLSHGHGDHIGDTITIAQQNNCLVIAAPEIIDWLAQKGLKNLHPVNHGSSVDFGFGKVRAVNAIHSSGLPDGSYGGNPLGFVLTSSQGNFYYSGDSALTMDMQLLPYYAKLDFAILPIGGNYTMDAADSLIAANFIKCDKIIGVHYNTFDLIKINTKDAQDLFSKAGKSLLLPNPGESLEL